MSVEGRFGFRQETKRKLRLKSEMIMYTFVTWHFTNFWRLFFVKEHFWMIRNMVRFHRWQLSFPVIQEIADVIQRVHVRCVCVKVVKVFILPVLRAEADRLQSVLEGPLGNNTDRIAADHVKLALLVCRLVPFLRLTIFVFLFSYWCYVAGKISAPIKPVSTTRVDGPS